MIILKLFSVSIKNVTDETLAVTSVDKCRANTNGDTDDNKKQLPVLSNTNVEGMCVVTIHL